ncbi:MAG: lipopolysaccharide heptosyltransferase I [Thermodesulfovibrionales bacterium]
MIKRLWIINKDEWKKIRMIGATISELGRLFEDLKSERFDCVVDLQGLLRSGIIAKATGAPVRIGFMEAREVATLFYTHTVKAGKELHAVDRYMRIADFLGCDCDGIVFPFPPEVPFDDLNIPDGYGIIAPGARWDTKRWPSERFGEVASKLPVRTVVIGGISDKAIAQEVVRYSKGKAISVAGETRTRELIHIIKRARFMLCNDTGPMHIAAALGVPVFAIFGPTDPVKTGPYGNGHTVIRLAVPCSPCRKRTCDDLKCLRWLQTETVYEIIKEKLDERPSRKETMLC